MTDIEDAQEWSDGISLACQNSHVHGNWINSATDGGIVLFGSPGTLVENNTIWAQSCEYLINIVASEMGVEMDCSTQLSRRGASIWSISALSVATIAELSFRTTYA